MTRPLIRGIGKRRPKPVTTVFGYGQSSSTSSSDFCSYHRSVTFSSGTAYRYGPSVNRDTISGLVLKQKPTRGPNGAPLALMMD